MYESSPQSTKNKLQMRSELVSYINTRKNKLHILIIYMILILKFLVPR